MLHLQMEYPNQNILSGERLYLKLHWDGRQRINNHPIDEIFWPKMLNIYLIETLDLTFGLQKA